ncbi:MAG: hypothetical protein K8S97_04345, partial [Anaerolineae bacterium]|nr:hypothetical protein [Anaerolineae bacterium]
MIARRTLILLLLCALTLTGLPTASAQGAFPPTIFLFTSDVPSISVVDLEAGETVATLRWHIAHAGDEHTIRLYVYQDEAWSALSPADESLPPVGELPVRVEHPRNFGPPTFRLMITDDSGETYGDRMLVIPYAEGTADLTPVVFSFSALTQSVSAAELEYCNARVEVSWVVQNRRPLTHLLFEQIIGDEVVNVELPRGSLWIPSEGVGVVAPVAPPEGSPDSSTIRLRLRVIDVISADTVAELEMTVSITGTTALPPAGGDDQPPPATEEPTSLFGDLNLLADCTLFPPGVPDRGWIDSPGLPSPDGSRILYVNNGVGDAKLVVALATGGGQQEITAPDRALPVWPRPRWSPDSQWIAFSNIALTPAGGGTIYVISRDGADLRQIATYTGYYDDISWSADGITLHFTSGE